MKLKAIRGGNQRGYSFVSMGSSMTTEPVRITHGSESILTRLNESHRVPADLVVIDKRLYDSLDLEATTEVNIAPIETALPKCTEMTLVVSSKRDIDVKEVVKALSKRIEDMEEHLDGLILTIGQKLDLHPLGITIAVREMTPKSDELAAARVDWRSVLKVYLEADMGGKCFNLCLVTDLGAASKKSDIFLSSSEVQVVGDGVVKRYEAADQLSRALLGILSTCEGEAFFSSVVYSDRTTVYRAFDPEDGIVKDISNIRSIGIAESHSDWLSEQIKEHSDKPSNPSEGLKAGIEKAEELRRRKAIPTLLVFLSSGTYSLGPNPVTMVRETLANTLGVSLICVGLGNRCEDSILTAIADSGGGMVSLIKEISDISVVKDLIIQEGTRRHDL
ncbi:MAG: VWA domain-containing protein [Candidatus Thorarchaeota archaeon]|nr:VWA domain-containing protein [Candidatus Thorarchaeota archaeon]